MQKILIVIDMQNDFVTGSASRRSRLPTLTPTSFGW